ncbi:hypothetical protein Q5752_004695 [Cryptotrichosporon argae]
MSQPTPKRRRASDSPLPARKKRAPSPGSLGSPLVSVADAWPDWPAPRADLDAGREFIMDIVKNKRSVLIVPDKDADGLSAGTLLHRTLTSLSLPPDLIKTYHLPKGHNVHSDHVRSALEEAGTDRIVLLDQGSRPGRAIARPTRDGDGRRRVLIVDHHMADVFPDDALVVSACHSPPIATAALLTYMLLRPLHPVVQKEGWRVVVGVIGDLGPGEAKWGTPPWPAELGVVTKQFGSKVFSDAVACVNSPRRTAEYNVPKAWDIYLGAAEPRQLASNAFFQLCKMDVRDETERWARTAPKFSADGRVAVITIASQFQIHPVIATRWAGNLGRKSSKLVMVACANTAFNPDDTKVSFSCRLASTLKAMPEGERPNLIAMLNEYADGILGFRERVGEDFARGHKEATGGIIPKEEFERLLVAMGVGDKSAASPAKARGKAKGEPAVGQKGIQQFFKPATQA